MRFWSSSAPSAEISTPAAFNFSRTSGDFKASTIDLPVVMFHGWQDSYMRQPDARRLLEQFRGPKLLAETGGGHQQPGFGDSAVLYRAMAKFWRPVF